MSKGKVTWNDLHEAHQNELKKTYNLTPRQLEQQIRRHWDGANREERVNLYKTVYDKKK